MKSKVFDYIEDKSRKKFKTIVILIFITIIFLNLLMQLILFNRENLDNELMNNKNLMVATLYGSSLTNNTEYMDVDKIKDIEHINFVTENPGLIAGISSDNGAEDSISICKINKKYSEYVGLEKMEENTIYCSKSLVDKIENYTLDKPLDSLNISMVSYDKEPPTVLYDEVFVTEDTFDKIYKEMYDSEEYHENMKALASTPMYILGVDSADNIYSVVNDIKKDFSTYDTQVFYQAQGLQSLVVGSKKILVMQECLFPLSLMAVCLILIGLLSSVINGLSRDFMVLYVNGLSRKNMSKLFFGLMLEKIRKPAILAVIISFVVYAIFLKFTYTQDIFLDVGILIISNIVAFAAVLLTMKKIISSKISANTANDRITGILRN